MKHEIVDVLVGFSLFFSHICCIMANLLSQVMFVFLLFLVMIMYANKVETKGKEKVPVIKKKKELQHIFKYTRTVGYL